MAFTRYVATKDHYAQVRGKKTKVKKGQLVSSASPEYRQNPENFLGADEPLSVVTDEKFLEVAERQPEEGTEVPVSSEQVTEPEDDPGLPENVEKAED